MPRVDGATQMEPKYLDRSMQKHDHGEALKQMFFHNSYKDLDELRPLLTKETEEGRCISEGMRRCVNAYVETDEQALERIFTDIDSQRLYQMLQRLYSQDNETGRLITHNLLEAAYACFEGKVWHYSYSVTGQVELITTERKGINPESLAFTPEERMRHMLAKNEWIMKENKFYAEQARWLKEDMRKSTIYKARQEDWPRWEEALSTDWLSAGFEAGGPVTALDLAHELRATMRPIHPLETQVEDSERRQNYREYQKRLRAYSDVSGVCGCVASPGALGLLDAFFGAGRVQSKERRRQRPY